MNAKTPKRLLLSRYLRTFERGKLVALTHQLHPEPVYLLKNQWQEITSDISLNGTFDREIAEILRDHGLLIDEPITDDQALKLARSQTLHKLDRTTILYLMLAQGCNFACDYCPIPSLAKKHGDNLLSYEDAVAGIDLWLKHIKDYPADDDQYFLIFYGGEPLLNRNVFVRLLPYVAQLKKDGILPCNLELMLCTNGSLLDDELVHILVKYNVTVAIGVDGHKESNDLIRKTPDCNSTFDSIVDTVKRLVTNRVRVVASVIITSTNAKYLVGYHDFLRTLGIDQFGFNLMKGDALVKELNGGSMEDYCKDAAHIVLSGLKTMSDNEDYEYQLGKRLASLKAGQPFSIDCTCYGNQIVIQADGQVSNCPFLRIDQGHVRGLPDDFMIGKTEVVRKWRLRLPILSDSVGSGKNQQLPDGGGCAWNSSELYGDVLARDKNNSTFTKEVMNELIWTLLPEDKANSLRRGETPYWSYRRNRTLRTAGDESL